LSELARRHGITAFELFCAYHLGIKADGTYQFQNVHDVARRFGCPSGVIKQLLTEFDMDPDALVQSRFDIASAQVDIMCAPEGVSRRELAQAMYEEFCRAPRRARDWARELADDARENEKIFPDGRRATRASGDPSSRGRETPAGFQVGRGKRPGPRS
jgi:hypothetical protein